MPRKSEPLLSNCVRELRKHSELTQAELAKQTQVTRQTIVALETGAYVPSLTFAMRLARVFDCPVEDIFQLDEQ